MTPFIAWICLGCVSYHSEERDGNSFSSSRGFVIWEHWLFEIRGQAWLRNRSCLKRKTVDGVFLKKIIKRMLSLWVSLPRQRDIFLGRNFYLLYPVSILSPLFSVYLLYFILSYTFLNFLLLQCTYVHTNEKNKLISIQFKFNIHQTTFHKRNNRITLTKKVNF